MLKPKTNHRTGRTYAKHHGLYHRSSDAPQAKKEIAGLTLFLIGTTLLNVLGFIIGMIQFNISF
jgi:hypothetical protein